LKPKNMKTLLSGLKPNKINYFSSASS